MGPRLQYFWSQLKSFQRTAKVGLEGGLEGRLTGWQAGAVRVQNLDPRAAPGHEANFLMVIEVEWK